MERYKYIIIDDETPTHLTVKHHFNVHKNYLFVASFFDSQQALLFLEENEIDLIFLDIEMPEMNGFNFLESLKKNIFIVILTAYPDRYSFEAHNYYDKDLVFFTNKAQFVYYLPKIIARFEKMFNEKMILNRVKKLSKNEILTFPKTIHNKTIQLSDIVYFKVFGHYMVLKKKDGEEFIDRMTIGELLSILPEYTFFQINRNIIINIEYVVAFSLTTVCVENEHFKISTRKQKEVIKNLKQQKKILMQFTN